MLLLFVGEKLLMLWFTPAVVAVDNLLRLVQPFFVPSSLQWLR